MGVTGRYEEYSKKEISFIETELKDWFLQRRFAMERNMAVKKTLDENNFTGLSMANADVNMLPLFWLTCKTLKHSSPSCWMSC